jgi:hypothetical protein
VLVSSSAPKKAPKRKSTNDPLDGVLSLNVTSLLDNGVPDAEKAVGAIQKLAEDEARRGKRSVTVVIDASFLLEKPGMFSRYMQVEGAFGLAVFKIPTTLICLYDDTRFTHEQIELAMSMHPLVVQGGALTRNFWLIPRNVDASSLAGYASTGRIH